MKSFLFILATVFRMVVIPAQFSDCQFSADRSEIVSAAESMQDYFNRQFGRECTFTFEVSPTVTLSRAHSYYGANYTDRKDALLHELVRESCNLAGSTDFASCDNDGDGFVDNVMIFTAGKSETDGAGEDWIYPQRDFLRSHGRSMSMHGVKIDSYTVVPEGKLGIACHEMGHVLGLYDLYDTDGESSGGTSPGLWGTGLMDRGCLGGDGNTPPNFNALDMNLLKLGQCVAITKGKHTLSPVNTGKIYYRMDTDTEGEYFLFECRASEGNDKNIGGSGMLVYHVDTSYRPAGYSEYYQVELNAFERWQKDQINCRPDRQCAMIVAADPDAKSSSAVFFPQKGVNSLGSSSNPAFRYWSGKPSPFALTGITLGSDGSVSFEVIEPISITGIQAWQDAATICWTADNSLHDISSYEIEWSDGQTRESMTGDGSILSFTLEGLRARTAYTFTLTVFPSSGDGFSVTGEFTTKALVDGTFQYIYLQSATRSTDGKFIAGSRIPLRVFNAFDAEYVEWFMDGKSIHVDKNGYYTIEGNGCLKAKVHMKDGSTNVLIKEIITK